MGLAEILDQELQGHLILRLSPPKAGEYLWLVLLYLNFTSVFLSEPFPGN